VELARKIYNVTKNTLLFISSLAFLMSGPASYIVHADECDPNDPNYYSKRAFRATNDILYFDPCAGDCSTGGSTGASPSKGGGDLQKVVDEAIASAKGKGVDLRVVVSGDASASGGEAGQMPSASTIKLLIAAALSVKNVPLASVSNQLALMINKSDNGMANILIDKAGGFDSINAVAAQLGVGGDMHIGRYMMASTAGGDPNTISAKGSDTLLNTIKQSATDGGKISKEYANFIVDNMKAQTVNTKWGASGIPKENMAHKTGELGPIQHDVGFFFKGDKWLTVTTLSNDPSHGDGSQGVEVVKDTAKKIYDAWGGSSATPPAGSAGCCSKGGGGGSLLKGDNNAERAYNYLIGKGYTPEQAAGVVGNMIHESGVNPMRVQGSELNSETPVDKLKDMNTQHGEAYGIVQWDPSGKMIKKVQEKGGDPTQLGAQLDFLTGDGGFTGGASSPEAAGQKVKEAKTVEEATTAFMVSFEAPGNPALDNRLTFAQAIYNKATKGDPYPPDVEAHIFKGSGDSMAGGGGGGGGCGTSTVDNGECKNPFRDLKDSAVMRMDGGLDYGGDHGSGPVYATCPATIKEVANGSWPGTPGLYLRYEVTAGKAKGLHMYISEDCSPLVKTGDTVTADTPICQYEDRGTHLEIGWAKEDCYCGTASSYVSWSDYEPQNKAGNNGYVGNSGIDVSKFLETLGVAPGIDSGTGRSNAPPPSNWPKW
jgi:hypothetical protein